MLQFQQRDFPVQTTCVASELTRRSDNAVARDQNAPGISSNGGANGAARTSTAHRPGNFPVAHDLTTRNVPQLLPHGTLKFSALVPVEGEFGQVSRAQEIPCQPVGGGLKHWVGAVLGWPRFLGFVTLAFKPNAEQSMR